MDFDLDPFDDKPAKVRPSGRFKPKAKLLARKDKSAPVPEVLPSASKGETETQTSTNTYLTKPNVVNTAVSRSDDGPGVHSSTIAESEKSEKPLKSNGVIRSEDEKKVSECMSSTPDLVENSVNADVEDALPSEGARLDGNGNFDHSSASLSSMLQPVLSGLEEVSGYDGNGFLPSHSAIFTREADPLEFPLDGLDDILLNPSRDHEEAQGRFQPKAMLLPTKKIAALGTSALPCDAKEKPDTTSSVASLDNIEAIQTVIAVNSSLNVSSFDTLRNLGMDDSLEDIQGSTAGLPFPEGDGFVPENFLAQAPVASAGMGLPGQLVLDIATSDGTGNWKSNSRKSIGENADVTFGSECVDDFLPQLRASVGSAARVSQSDVDENAQPAIEFQVPFPVTSVAECSQMLSQVPSLTGSVCNEADEDTAIHIPSSGNDPNFTVGSGLDEEAGDTFNSHSFLHDTQLVPPESGNVDESHFDEEPTNCVDTSPSHGVALSENDAHTELEVNGISSATGRKGTPSLGSTQFVEAQKVSSDSVEKSGNSARRLRARVAARRLADASADDAHESGGFFSVECSRSLRDDESDDDHDDEYGAETSSRKKQAPRKSKEPVVENGKKVRKRKKVIESQEGMMKEPPKKFSHSARRKRRLVDKALLDIPQDELDLQNIRIKDLIWLGEKWDKSMNKESASLKTPFTNQSASGYTTDGAPYNEVAAYDEDAPDIDFASTNDKDNSNGEENITVQEDTGYFNYQSYMNKLPRSRWSKQDTELFYEAVRQFGTDISMIQQLFPNRTRRQVLLKYKKEERHYPSRLDDALRNRTKDHSHFKKVIELLQQSAPEEKLNSSKDDSIGMGNENIEEVEAVSSKPKGQQCEGVKREQREDGALAEDEDILAVGAAQSPVKSHGGDDDFTLWCSYNSEV